MPCGMCLIPRCVASFSLKIKAPVLLGILMLAILVMAAQNTPEPPGMVATPDRLAAPTLPANPAPADQGALVYYYVCMACHGDRGQGLSEEWIDAWELGEESCWQSKCHAANHPEEGFELPRTIPPVIYPGILRKYSTALTLHDYIKSRMPWHAPGSLSDVEYWQLTAFLLRENGIDPGGAPLDEDRAALIFLSAVAPATPLPTAPPPTSQVYPPSMPPASRSEQKSSAGAWIIASLLGVVTALLLIYVRKQQR